MAEWIVTYTSTPVEADTEDEAIEREGSGGGHWEATPVNEIETANGLTRGQREIVAFYADLNVPVQWFIGAERDDGWREVIALGGTAQEGFIWSLLMNKDGTEYSSSESTTGPFETGINV